MSYQNNAPSTYYHSEFSALNQEIEQNDLITDYYYYETPNPDFMEKNNYNSNLNDYNGENFLTNINQNFEKNFDYDKEDLSIFQKDINENNSVPLPYNSIDKEQAPKIDNLNNSFSQKTNEINEINMGCPQNVTINNHKDENNNTINKDKNYDYLYIETPGNINIEEQKEKFIFEDEITPTIDSKNDNDNIILNGNLLKESSIEVKNEKEIASMINNILNSSQAAPLTIEKNNVGNNFDTYSSTINTTENYGFGIENIIKEENIFIDEEKKKKLKKIRKYKPDGIRKKIKARTHKNIKKILNANLCKYNSKMLFDYLPQVFICDVTIKPNKKILNLTLEQLYLYDFGGKHQDKEKLETNRKVINYLKNNPIVCEKSGVNILLMCSYRKILNDYFKSNMLEKDLENLRQEGEDDLYIQLYKYYALNFVSFYENDGKIISYN